jgi:hypothetical protein
MEKTAGGNYNAKNIIRKYRALSERAGVDARTACRKTWYYISSCQQVGNRADYA